MNRRLVFAALLVLPCAAHAVQAPTSAAGHPVAVKVAAKTGGALSDADARALAQKSGCFACHMIDKKLVGPSWKEVGAKYRGQKDAEAKLVAKVAKGGSGVWGSAVMPPNAPKVSNNDIKALVRYVLKLK